MLLRHKSHQTSTLVCFMVRPKPFVALSSAAENSRRREEGKRRKAGRKESDEGSLAGAWADSHASAGEVRGRLSLRIFL